MAYSGARRGPNVAQYLANLNSTSPPTGSAGLSDDLNFDDLDTFAAGQFLNLDQGEQPGSTMHFTTHTLGETAPNMLDLDPVHFDESGLPISTLPYLDAPASASSYGVNNAASASFADPFDFNASAVPSANNGSALGTEAAATRGSPSTKTSPVAAVGSTAVASPQRPMATVSGAGLSGPDEAASRAAAEEDKRRRNTAASARFRVKKKQREQALEKTAHEASDRAKQLEARVQELERENGWLRGLLTEKSAAKPSSSSSSSTTPGSKAEVSTITSSPKKGVGTA